jgi:hypothetical protein
MTNTVTIQIDLANNVCAIHGVDATGGVVIICPVVPHAKLLALIASILY